MSEEASEQDKTIARVVLAGCCLEPTGIVVPGHRLYRVWSPAGVLIGTSSTRYTAAVKAEQWLSKADRLEALLPQQMQGGA